MAKETDSLLHGNDDGSSGDPNTDGGINRFMTRHRLWLVLPVMILAVILFLAGVGFEDLRTTGSPHASTQSSASSSTASTITVADVVPQTRDSKYRATQFISFSINTMGGLADHGECEGLSVDANGVCYLGNKEDLIEDVGHRFKIVADVLEALVDDKLSEFPDVDHSPDVLKIFMLPEFYMRGPNGAYSIDQLTKEDGIIFELGKRVHTVVEDPMFEHYLFVFGTIIAAQSPNDPKKAWETALEKEGDILYYNLAPIYKGGPPEDGVKKRFMVQKEYISTADFLHRENGGLADPRHASIQQYSDLADDGVKEILAARNVTLLDENVLEIDGIRIGIEICVDHRLGVLWDKISSQNLPLVDVQLITSAGMAIERGPNPIVPGGVVYLSDGEASSAACQRSQSDTGPFHELQVCREMNNDGPAGLKHVPNGGEGYSGFIGLAACLNPPDAKWKPLMEGYYSLYQTQGCAFTLKLYGIDVMDEYSYYPPSIEIYPTIDLPFTGEH